MSKFKLYEHQIKSLELTKDKNKVAYYLDMGLGKTFVGAEKLNQLNEKLNIVICQKSKIDDWINHFNLYYPEYIVFNGRESMYETDIKTIVVINYDLIWRRDIYLAFSDFTLMLDESSLISNKSSERTKFIMKLKSKNVILLSGTPSGGKYENLITQINLLGWSISQKVFYNHYVDFSWEGVEGATYLQINGYKRIDRLNKKLKENGCVFMETSEVFDLPDMNDYVIPCKKPTLYNKFLKDKIVYVDDEPLVGDSTFKKLLYQRQLASIHSKDKFIKITNALESTENRVIIFYNWKVEFEKLKGLCFRLEKPVSFINGNGKDLKNYNQYENTVTLCQYQAGSMGHDLQLAHQVFYISPPLGSVMYQQSKKRIHRIGQTKKCFYYHFISKFTIEEDIYESIKNHRDYDLKLFEKTEDNDG